MFKKIYNATVVILTFLLALLITVPASLIAMALFTIGLILSPIAFIIFGNADMLFIPTIWISTTIQEFDKKLFTFSLNLKKQ